MKTFKSANEEFAQMAKELYEQHKKELGLTVDPSKVIFLRVEKKKGCYAYCKMVSGECATLTDKRFFIVIISENFDNLKTLDEKKYALLHELHHLHYDDEKDKYHLLKHNLENFQSMVVNAAWKLEMIKHPNTSQSPKVVPEKTTALTTVSKCTALMVV